MRKSPSPCLKIITCGAAGDSIDDEDLFAAESKPSPDKRRWGLRKRSVRHQVLSNSVISEPLSASYNKEYVDIPTNNCDSPINLYIPERVHVQESQLKTPPMASGVVNSRVADTLPASKSTTVIDNDIQESVYLVIQAAIRGDLARRELQKLQKVIKLQAIVRGHLVRRQAVGTLHCIQAIAKLQLLVRARYAHQTVDKLMDQESGEPQEKKTTCNKLNKTYAVTLKLLSNGFARQLLELTPKTKLTNIKCDSLRADSTWKWLERWMTVITSDEVGWVQGHGTYYGSQGQEDNTELVGYDGATKVPNAVKISKTTDGQGNLPSKSSGGTDFQGNLEEGEKDQSQLENGYSCTAQVNFGKTAIDSYSFSGQMPLQPDATPESILDSSSEKPETDRSANDTAKILPSESLETEEKALAFGPWKACNPAFVAAQSKVEELSSTPTVQMPIKATSRDAAVESKVDSLHTRSISLSKTENRSLIENSGSPRVQATASEYGTEISITSTFNSPDRYEAEVGEIVLEVGSFVKVKYDVNDSADNAINHENINAEQDNCSLEPQIHQLQKDEHGYKSLASLFGTDRITSDVQAQMENSIVQQYYKSSSDASPRTHIRLPESHGTPSSQILVYDKESKKDNSMSKGKQKSQIVSKRSPPNLKIDSGGRSSTKHLPLDTKNSKRQNPFSIIVPDYVDHEPRISTSSLPSFMQATASARAKAHVNLSLKSSPDVHNNGYLKKRHSLPITNAKQGSSPRLKRSTSGAIKIPKGNEAHSPHNSAERRWQR